jgi:hypothetical protein
MRKLRSLKAGVYFFVILSFLLSCVLPGWASPTVSITNPQNGGQVNGKTVIDVTYQAEAGVPVTSILLYVDGKQVQQFSLSLPKMMGQQSFPWDFTLSTGQTHTISARAIDAQGQAGNATITVRMQSAEVSAAVDQLPPTVNIYFPAHGAKIHGMLKIKATATDNVGVVAVCFYVDGKCRSMLMNAPPYTTEIDTSKMSDGPHTLSASAYDDANNEGKSAEITIFVQNKSLTVGPDTPAPDETQPEPAVPGATAEIPQVTVPSPTPAPEAPAEVAPQAPSASSSGSEATLAPAAIPPGAATFTSDTRIARPSGVASASSYVPLEVAPRVGGPSLAAEGPRIAVIQPPAPLAPMPNLMPATGSTTAPDMAGQMLAATPNGLRPGTLDTRIGEPTATGASGSCVAPLQITGTRGVTGAAPSDAYADTLCRPLASGPALSVRGARTAEPSGTQVAEAPASSLPTRAPGPLAAMGPQTGAALSAAQPQQVPTTTRVALVQSGPRLAALDATAPAANPDLTVPAPVLGPAPSLVVPQTGAALTAAQPQQVTATTRATLAQSGPRLAALETTAAPSAIFSPAPSRVPQTDATLTSGQPEQITTAARATLSLSGARTSAPEETAPATAVVATPATAAPAQAAGYAIALSPARHASAMKLDQPPAGLLPVAGAALVATAQLRAVLAIVNDAKVDLHGLQATSPASLLALREVFQRCDGNLYWFAAQPGQAPAPYVRSAAGLLPLQFLADALRVSLRFSPDSGQLLLSSTEF